MTQPTLEQLKVAKNKVEHNLGYVGADRETLGVCMYAIKQAEKIAHGELFISQGWQPIETAPKDGQAILVFIKSPKTGDTWPDVVFYNDIEKQFMHGTTYVGHDFITHWQPLPQPPKEAINHDACR